MFLSFSVKIWWRKGLKRVGQKERRNSEEYWECNFCYYLFQCAEVQCPSEGKSGGSCGRTSEEIYPLPHALSLLPGTCSQEMPQLWSWPQAFFLKTESKTLALLKHSTEQAWLASSEYWCCWSFVPPVEGNCIWGKFPAEVRMKAGIVELPVV